MKINTQRHDVDANGMMNQRKFTVDAGAHIMAVLSGLYKNPVDAMVREYLTNMFDAYVALKRVRPDAEIVPPVLHLPTALDGNLTFRDYGIGMSLETVWNVYATYGASTKNGSNDEVGGFGLGSKTAFCYNGGASWTIESRYQGEKHIFMAFIGEDGVPNLSHVTTVTSDEPSGLTISIPVRREDHRACIEAANKYVPYFPMSLTVEGATIQPVKYLLKAEKWAIRPSAGRYDNQSRIIMGNVPYPIDQNSRVSVKIANVDDWTVREFLQANSIDFFVNIGDVDIVPSRDDMKYTDRTKAVIATAIERMMTELGSVVGQQLDACNDEWSALTTYRNMTMIHRLHEVVRTLKWRGQTIAADGIVRKLEDLQKLDKTATVTRYAILGGDHRATPEVYESPAELLVNPAGHTFVVIDDLPKGGAMLARALVHQKLVHKTSAGRSARYGHTPGHVLLIKTTLSKAQLGAYFGGMPETQVTTTMELKGVVPVPANLKVTKDTIYRWSGTSWNARVNIPTGTAMYYLPLTKDTYTKRFSFVNNRYGSQKDTIQAFRKAAGTLGIKVDTLYGIKADDVANFDSSWVNLVTAMEAEMLKQIKANAMTFAMAKINLGNDVLSMVHVISATGMDKEVADAKKLVEMYQFIEMAQRSPVLATFNNLSQRIPTLQNELLTAVASVKVQDVQVMLNNLVTQYPMVGVLSQIYGANYYGHNRAELLKKNSQKVLAYVKAIS
jgi:hypothetical protein